MTKERAAALAATLQIGLHSPGVCPACISFVAIEIDHGNERRVAGQITSFAPLLWAKVSGRCCAESWSVVCAGGTRMRGWHSRSSSFGESGVPSSGRWCGGWPPSFRRG
jgi:hypothetical protein